MARSAVVTGASTGIGLAACEALLEAGWRVFGSVRNKGDAERLAGALGASFTPLIFDVTDEAAIEAAAATVADALGTARLDALVNNAGIAVAGPLLHLPLAEFERQIDVNVTGVLRVTRAFAPRLGADPARTGAPGRIVNIGSVSGENAFPFTVAYSTSKFALEGMTEGLRRELMPFGIDVIMLAPAAVRTPIWDKAEAVDTAPYAGTVYAAPLAKVRDYMLETGRNGLPVERLGALVRRILTTPRPRVRYVAAGNRFEVWLLRRLPKRLIDRMIAGRIGLGPIRDGARRSD